jgi:hypothetical protein
MADELGDMCKRISLTEGEKEGIRVEELDVSEARVIAGSCLIGKIWTDRNVNQEAFKSIFSNIWRIVGSVKFKKLKDNIWLFEFSDEGDKLRVLDGRPWSFDRQIVVLNEFDGSTPPSQLEFNHSPFWVQVHNMPLLCMNKNVGTKIGNSLGDLADVDVAGNGLGWGSYLRLRVSLDITKPLDRGRALNFAGKTSWIEFKYEKLPLLCFRCGRIVHGPRGCPMTPATHLHDREEPKQWGSWLRATDLKRRAKVGSGVRGGAYPNQAREGEEDDGAQSDERPMGMASAGSLGNPIRGTNPTAPARSAESGVSPARNATSGTYHSGDTLSCNIGKGKGKMPSLECSNDKGVHEVNAFQADHNLLGRDMGRTEEVQTGLVENGAAGVQGALCQTTNMEIIPTSPAVIHLGDELEGRNITPQLNLKKWKRRARHVNQASASSQTSKNAKKGWVGELGSEKRLKIVDATRGQSTEILAEAVVQPRQEP